MARERRHGTVYSYRKGCRCGPCVDARTVEKARQRNLVAARRTGIDRDLLAQALDQLFPFGLTDDCPARRGAR